MSSFSASFAAGLLALVVVSACSTGPTYRRPILDTPIAFKEVGEWKPASPADQVARGAWWEIFNDPVLNQLEAQIDLSNNTLAQAEAEFRQAQAVVRTARAALFPSARMTVGATRQKTSTRAGSGSSAPENMFDLGVAANWELDLWGRLRQGLQASRASAEASAADLESARLSLHATFAQTYFALRTADTQIQLFDRLSQAYTQFLEMTENRYRQGVAARSEIASAQAQLKSIEAQKIDFQLTRAQLEHALAVLLGQPPARFSLVAVETQVNLPNVPSIVPSQLLERRPDIAAAERRLAAASAEIGVAKAGYFPTLSLDASASNPGSTLATLFTLPTAVWALGASATESIFDGGKVKAAVAQARAVYDADLAAYRQTILVAFQDVEGNFAANRILAEEAVAQDQAVAAARQALDLIQNQYKAGTVSHLEVITAQATLWEAERNAAALQGRRFETVALLFKAIGGGWQDSM